MQEVTNSVPYIPSFDFQYYLNNIISYFSSNSPEILSFSKSLIGILMGLSIPFSLLLIIVIFITMEKLKAIRRREYEIYNAKVDAGYEEVSKSNEEGNKEMANRWEMIKTHLESKNENDWRQAVIEADIILGDILTKLGYKGEGIGEQLKRANKGDFKTLDDAWEAHKVRNELAHTGSDFAFSQHDAKRIIHLYKKVFEEFYYI